MQEELAPFALGNLRCAGDEPRLVDCPVFDPAQDVAADGQPDYDDYGTRTSICDPYQGTFARVACGTGETASTYTPICMLVIGMPLPLATVSDRDATHANASYVYTALCFSSVGAFHRWESIQSSTRHLHRNQLKACWVLS